MSLEKDSKDIEWGLMEYGFPIVFITVMLFEKII